MDACKHTGIPKAREVTCSQALREINHYGCAALGRVEGGFAGTIDFRRIDVDGREGLKFGDVGEVQY